MQADETDREDNVQKAEAADCSTKRRMQNHVPERGVVSQKEILLPEAGPRQIQEQGSHFEAQYDQ